MMIKLLKNTTNKHYSSLVKIAGLFVCLSILIVMSACREDDVIYECNDSDGTTTNNIEAEYASIEYTPDSDTIKPGIEDIEGETYIVVHLCGAVNNPGVYELEYNSRIIDGIIKAGGFTTDASEDALNLAATLSDGSKVYVPTIDEAAQADSSLSNEDFILTSANTSDSNNSSNSLVNINTAGIDILTTLTGIGDTRAKAIIAYREEHGAFKSIEEIMNVTGIKEGSFNKIKDSITVN